MEAVTEAAQASSATLLRRDRTLVLGACGLVSLLAWAHLVMTHGLPGIETAHLHHPAVHAIDATTLGLAFVFWWIMMVAMMLPPVLPWILLHARSARGRSDPHPYRDTILFTAGYFIVWAGYSVVAAGLQLVLQQRLLLEGSDLRLGVTGAGALLVGAGVFQLSPLKQACLKHCRSPIGFFLSEWRPGAWGSLRMGLRHGSFCVTCCWALMALSFALGVMNLIWMALLTIVLCIEKIAPGGQTFSRVAGLGFLAWGLWLIVV